METGQGGIVKAGQRRKVEAGQQVRRKTALVQMQDSRRGKVEAGQQDTGIPRAWVVVLPFTVNLNSK